MLLIQPVIFVAGRPFGEDFFKTEKGQVSWKRSKEALRLRTRETREMNEAGFALEGTD